MMPDRFTAFESTRASIPFAHASFEVAVVAIVSGGYFIHCLRCGRCGCAVVGCGRVVP
jgi:hypothetical protein